MQAKYTPSETVDFIVIGSGAAGGAVAKELSVAGYRVVVLEQGPYLKEKDFKHDEILHSTRSPLMNDPRLQPSTFRKNDTEQFTVGRSAGYGRQVGGGTVHFTANYWRFHEIDFHEREMWGPIAGTGFDNWPISYAELEPYYTKAEWDVGVSGLAGANPFDSFRSKPFPLPPLPVKSSGVLFERGAKKLGLHPYPSPMAILSQPYRGRGACTHCGFCMRYGCEIGAKSSTLASLIRVAERTGKCEIRADSYVRRIQTDDNGRVTGAVYFDKDRREVFQKAKAVVLCANGAESPRLLLMSKSNRFPNGLANSSGLVGKYLMYDSGTTVHGMFEHPLNEYKSVEVTRVVQDHYNADPKRGFYGGGGMDSRFGFNPISFATRGLPPELPTWGAEYKKSLVEYYTHTMSSMSHTTTLPLPTNRIELDPELKDDWGLPAMRITYQNHPDDIATLAFVRERQMEVLEAAGAKKVWGRPVREIRGSVHLMGTARMGNDPQKSVVDKFHRAHDVRNLFVVDGSSFVTSGRQQPTLTIQALAYRAADFMVRSAKAGEI
ncbi:MAG TPA: GMC family oxidoreductase [Bryobacteraceae bacterium]|nr:GMC family oxidoreductase [Bryobacteraceae bacterium]